MQGAQGAHLVEMLWEVSRRELSLAAREASRRRWA